MDSAIILSNITNPTLLFFLLGIFASLVKSDLEIPDSSIKFISLYLLFSIGFKGGQELSYEAFNLEIIYSLLFGLAIASAIPLVTFFVLKQKIGIHNAGAVAATYGSVSAVTFVAASSFLEARGISYGGHMVAVMALMEVPAIIVGVILVKKYHQSQTESAHSLGKIFRHSVTNGSVLMILGSLLIGAISDSKQAEGIRPFTTDIFKGFLAIFLLEMGLLVARRIKSCFKYGKSILVFATVAPLFFGCFVAFVGQFITQDPGNRFMFAVLAASASYIAVPAAMRLAVPEADPGLYIPMALGLTFPLNLTLGMPLYLFLIG